MAGGEGGAVGLGEARGRARAQAGLKTVGKIPRIRISRRVQSLCQTYPYSLRHWTPACVSYAARWHPPPQLRDHLASSSAARLEWESGGFWDFFLLPLLPYLLWALLYYLKVR